MSCLYSIVESFCNCFIKVPTITGVLHVPILLANSFCNHLAEKLMAEANFEMLVFFILCVSCQSWGLTVRLLRFAFELVQLHLPWRRSSPKWCCIFSFYHWDRATRGKMEMHCFGMMCIGYIAFFPSPVNSSISLDSYPWLVSPCWWHLIGIV